MVRLELSRFIRRLAQLVLLCALLSVGPAAAAKGTHFLAEQQVGAALHEGGGLCIGGLLGGGGRIARSPLRAYILAEFGMSTEDTRGRLLATGLHWSDSRAQIDTAVLLRAYVLLPGRSGLRLFADLGAGGTYVSARLEREGLPPRQASGWHGLGLLAGGLQLRLRRWVSVGLRYKLVPTGDDIAGLRALVGQSSPLRQSLTGSLSWHF